MYSSAVNMLEKEHEFVKENEIMYVVSQADREFVELMVKLIHEMKVVAKLHPAIVPEPLTTAVIILSLSLSLSLSLIDITL